MAINNIEEIADETYKQSFISLDIKFGKRN